MPADALSYIPEGTQYNNLRWMLQVLQRDFPDLYSALSSTRVTGWVQEIDSGGRDADQIRDDIVYYVIGEDRAKEKYGITSEQFESLVLGGNEGGLNFSDIVTDAGGGVITTPTAPKEETQAEEGVGGGGEDPETQLHILTGKEMKWHFDPSSGKWYVSYGLPGSERALVFEADPDQMDALFGDGMRPMDYERVSLKNLLGRTNITFGGNVAEMEGTGTFESEYERIKALALDEGRLPEWASGSAEIHDIIFIAQAEGKTDDWVIEQIAKTKDFQARFPQIEKFRTSNNLTMAEAVTGFLEYETGLKNAAKAYSQDLNVSPELVGQMLNAGHALDVAVQTIQGFRRMEEFAPALDAFNQILAAQGADPITDIQDMFDFVTGKASADLYDLWEQSSIQEAAIGAGLGDIFSVDDAIAIGRATNQTLDSATSGMRKAAELLLRLRHEVAVGEYGLDHEELIDISMGMTPRSGRSEVEILENINRAVSAARGSLQQRGKPFTSFSRTGTPQAASLAGLRPSS